MGLLSEKMSMTCCLVQDSKRLLFILKCCFWYKRDQKFIVLPPKIPYDVTLDLNNCIILFRLSRAIFLLYFANSITSITCNNIMIGK